jgi:hypothetical protein
MRVINAKLQRIASESWPFLYRLTLLWVFYVRIAQRQIERQRGPGYRGREENKAQVTQ